MIDYPVLAMPQLFCIIQGMDWLWPIADVFVGTILVIVKPEQAGTCGRSIRNEHIMSKKTNIKYYSL